MPPLFGDNPTTDLPLSQLCCACFLPIDGAALYSSFNSLHAFYELLACTSSRENCVGKFRQVSSDSINVFFFKARQTEEEDLTGRRVKAIEKER